MSEALLYRPYVSRSEPRAYIDEGTPVTVNGTPMVQWGPLIVPASEWSGSKATALQAAAAELEARAAQCQAEADRLRKEAANAMATG